MIRVVGPAADAALAAAPEGAVAAPGGAGLRSFPVILETYRECLQDVFDLPALRRLLASLRSRELDLVDVETPSASPFAASLLFDYIATACTRTTRRRPSGARRRCRSTASCCASCSASRSSASSSTRALWQRWSPRSCPARAMPTSCDLLRRAGDLRPDEADAGFAETLLRERRALRIPLADEQRLIAAEDAGRYRDAFRVVPPGGLPDAFLEPVEDAVASVLTRFARSRGPFTTADMATRYGLRRARRGRARGTRDRRTAGPRRAPTGRNGARVVRPGRAPPAAAGPLAVFRREVEPVDQAVLGRFLPTWHGVGRRSTLREAIVPLQGLPLPVALWESDVLPRRVPGYQPSQLDALCASGEVVWVGAGLDRVALYFRDDAAALGPPGGAPFRRERRRRRSARRFTAVHSSGRISSPPPVSTPPTHWRCCGSSSGPAR